MIKLGTAHLGKIRKLHTAIPSLHRLRRKDIRQQKFYLWRREGGKAPSQLEDLPWALHPPHSPLQILQSFHPWAQDAKELCWGGGTSCTCSWLGIHSGCTVWQQPGEDRQTCSTLCPSWVATYAGWGLQLKHMKPLHFFLVSPYFISLSLFVKIGMIEAGRQLEGMELDGFGSIFLNKIK